MRRWINQGQTCRYDGCDRPAKRIGLCQGHSALFYNGIELRPLRVLSGKYKKLGKIRFQADYALRKKYGFGIEELEARVAIQNNVCPISFLSFTKTPSVDHIGTFGQPDFVIRGLVTRQANFILGYLEGLERLGADLQKISAPHVYDYIMRGREQQKRQLDSQSRGATA